MIRKFWLTGSVALTFLLGALVLAAPAQAYVQDCDTFGSGTQAYAECMVRAEDREAAPIIPLSERPAETTTTVVETTSTEVWQLAVAGLGGALVAIGATMAVVRLGQRQRVTAH
jgi:hypothetical protein